MSANEKPRVPDFQLQTDATVGEVDVFLGNNLITGSPLVGDKIKLEDGRLLVVTERTWLSGKDRNANMLITLALSQ